MGDIFGSAMRSFVTTFGFGILVLLGMVTGFVYVTFRLS